MRSLLHRDVYRPTDPAQSGVLERCIKRLSGDVHLTPANVTPALTSMAKLQNPTFLLTVFLWTIIGLGNPSHAKISRPRRQAYLTRPDAIPFIQHHLSLGGEFFTPRCQMLA